MDDQQFCSVCVCVCVCDKGNAYEDITMVKRVLANNSSKSSDLPDYLHIQDVTTYKHLW